MSRPLRGGANVGSESSSSCWEVRPVYSTSGIVGFVIVGPLCPCTVCCHASSTAWAVFLQVQLTCRVLRVDKGIEEGGGGC